MQEDRKEAEKMNLNAKKAVLKGVFTMSVVAAAGFFLFNGFGRHPYTYAALEGVFRAEAAKQGVVATDGEQLISEPYGNSITFAMQTKDGKQACATYARSMFFDKYKELSFSFGEHGEQPTEDIVYAEENHRIQDDSITYSVNDGVIAYQTTVQFGDAMGIQFSDEVKPMMYLKFMVVCLAAMGIFGVRIFLSKR